MEKHVKTKVHKTTKPVVPHKKERYFESIGRRKTAIARVRLFTHRPAEYKEGQATVNGRSLEKYFSLPKHRHTALAPFEATSVKDHYLTAQVRGGGLGAQAEAIRLGLARTIVSLSAENRPKLKALGFLKRDPRMVERKKFGSRKARRPQQWRKR